MSLRRVAKDIQSFVASKDLIVFAVGVALSNQLQATLNTLITSLIMPFVSYWTGVNDLSSRTWVLNEGEPGIKLNWGAAANAIITFTITIAVLVEFTRFVTTKYVKSQTIQWQT